MPSNTEQFLTGLFRELAEGRYGVRAWGVFWRRAWERSSALRAAEPRRVWGFVGWAGMGLVLGAAVVALGSVAEAGGFGPADGLFWLGWYGAICGWTWLHLGRIRREDGRHFNRFGIPNGLSFLRLGLAPLVVTPTLVVGPRAGEVTRVVLVSFLALLALSDLVDGWLARRRDEHSALGRVLDPMADLALLSFLAYGLWRAELVPGLLLVLLLLRYPGALLGAVVLYIARGPRQVTATPLGKVTTATSFLLLSTAAIYALLRPGWLDPLWLRAALYGLIALVTANLAYLVFRAVRWW